MKSGEFAGRVLAISATAFLFFLIIMLPTWLWRITPVERIEIKATGTITNTAPLNGD